jgi:hypothetical protein
MKPLLSPEEKIKDIQNKFQAPGREDIATRPV